MRDVRSKHQKWDDTNSHIFELHVLCFRQFDLVFKLEESIFNSSFNSLLQDNKNIEHSTICIMGYFTFSSCSFCCVQVHIFQCKIQITNHFRALQFRLISAYKTMTTIMVLSLNLNTIQWIDFFSDHVLNIFHLECFFLHRRFSACSLFRVECGEKNQLKKNPYPLCYRNEREWLHSKSIRCFVCEKTWKSLRN